MILKQLIVSVLTLFVFQYAAIASPTLSTYSSGIDKPFKKNIYKGNQEVGLGGGLGYSSFSGVTTEINAAYRYFFMDKVSFGGILGHSYSDIDRSYDLGISSRWYFAELGNWAFALTQNLVFSYNRFNAYYSDHTGVARAGELNGLTQLSANYFFTPEVYLEISLDYNYNITHSSIISPPANNFTSRFGFGITF